MKRFFDFKLKNSVGKEVTLSKELENSNVLLFFYRGTFWGVWATQLEHVGHMYKELQDLNTKVFAISVDNSEKAEVMKEKTKATFDFLCDERMEAIELYDLKDHELMNWDFIDGKVRKTKTSRPISLSAYVLITDKGYIPYSWSGHYSLKPKIEDVIEVLKKIGG